MNVTVYLPDELGTWAKAAGLNLSGLLRAAVQDEKDHEEAITQTLEGAVMMIELELVSDSGQKYTGEFEGVIIGEGRDVNVYLTDDERLIVHDLNKDDIAIFDDGEYDAETIQGLGLDPEEFIRVCSKLGIKPRVKL